MQYWKPTPPIPPVKVGELRDNLGRHPAFADLIALLDEKLAETRTRYEAQAASDFLRGEIAGIKRIKDLLTNQV
jgi:hypothetical protein